MTSYSELDFLKEISKKDVENEEIKRKIGENIRTIRLIQGFTQKDLAKKYGCSRQNLSKFEQGDFTSVLTSLKSLRKIATLLNVTLLKLMEGVVPTKND